MTANTEIVGIASVNGTEIAVKSKDSIATHRMSEEEISSRIAETVDSFNRSLEKGRGGLYGAWLAPKIPDSSQAVAVEQIPEPEHQLPVELIPSLRQCPSRSISELIFTLST